MLEVIISILFLFLSVLRYIVTVYTSSIAKAATQANAFITLYGSEGDTGRRPLSDSQTSDSPFKKGQVDVFMVEAVHLGKLEKIIVEHDGTEPGM